MFTGIIEEVGEVTEAGEGTLRIRAPFVDDRHGHGTELHDRVAHPILRLAGVAVGGGLGRLEHSLL